MLPPPGPPTAPRAPPRALLAQWPLALAALSGLALAHVLPRAVLAPLAAVDASLAPLVALAGLGLGLRACAAYLRWREATAHASRLLDASRRFSAAILAYLPLGEAGAASALQRSLVRRHAAYVHLVRCALRDEDGLADPQVQRLLDPHDAARLAGEPSPCHALAQRQLSELASAAWRGELTEERLASLDRVLGELLVAQTAAERLARRPLPAGADLLPVGFGALAILLAPALAVAHAAVHAGTAAAGHGVLPLAAGTAVLVALPLVALAAAGHALARPFARDGGGAPLMPLALQIEAEVRARVGDGALPGAPRPEGRARRR
jgi:putative membrane protein